VLAYFKKVNLLFPLLLLLLFFSIIPTPATAADWHKVAEDVVYYLEQAAELYAQGDQIKAKEAVNQAYFGPFEETGMEAAVRLKISAQKSFELEYGFTELKQLIDQKVNSEQFNQAVTNLSKGVKAAATTMAGEKHTPWSTFLYSFLIIVREGFEAILIVGAIIAYLLKSGNAKKVPIIYQSVGAALLASIITALAFQYLFQISGAGQEILEGITMLLATVVLFSVSFWLVSKVESKKWQEYIEGKVKDSVGKGNSLALWFTAFLAVYREGAETVLFYQALLSDLEKGLGMVILGFIVGLIVLAFLFIAIRYGSMKLSLKPFFIGTSVLLYYMAFVFAGKGVKELQEGGLVSDTLIKGFPKIDLLGIYPSWETISLQILLLAVLIISLVYQWIKSGGDVFKQFRG